MKKCLNCEKLTTNPKFCSRSCAAIHTNSASPKRKQNRKCAVCDDAIFTHRHKFCEKHFLGHLSNKNWNIPISEYRNKMSLKGKPPSWSNVHIRNMARTRYKNLCAAPCAHCGYSKHVELAHIRSVSSFDGSALISEINARENIVQLCPNCHWEFDNLPRSPLSYPLDE